MWYIWKTRNDKLYREIDMDPLETVRHADMLNQNAMLGSKQTSNKNTKLHKTINREKNSERCMINGS